MATKISGWGVGHFDIFLTKVHRLDGKRAFNPLQLYVFGCG
jgi:hypothetical protein